ncbi:hypothetical protein [Hymenobacter cellulosivorans]|uniref:Uncharacterized protein n=1 Tax=Hymenobacter cellulosivorans TaxID=2932249 RepID=A0ABY4F6G3_9BACT|nr:hypothetical protein [Hymenobacter cellulosivorans]UOQ52123.1 hypothetical protein MUN80_20470 [Hymenobacter cellulosivorans]
MNHQFTAFLPSCLGHVSLLDLNQPTTRVRLPAERRRARSFDNTEVVDPYGPATDGLRFVLRRAAGGAAFLHLALFCRERQLAHWILPADSLPQPALTPPAYLVEATDSLPLPAHLIDEGTCLLRNCPTDGGASLEKELRAGYLQLTFAGRTLRGAFCLERLPADSHTWELGRERKLPLRWAPAQA